MIKIENFSLKYDERTLFENFNLTVQDNESTGIFAPTGSGKTTLFNQIIKNYADKKRISCVFQDNALIEELSVEKNIVLPLENLMPKEEAVILCEKLLEKLDLSDKKNKICKKLSGGEKQRVNIARAFAFDGEIFLFDEPFSAQDKEHKQIIFEMIGEIKNKKTVLLISHNESDLKLLCDRIIYL